MHESIRMYKSMYKLHKVYVCIKVMYAYNTYIYIYTYIHTYICIRVHKSMRTHTHTCIYMHESICMLASLSICICRYTHSSNARSCIYTHAYTYKYPPEYIFLCPYTQVHLVCELITYEKGDGQKVSVAHALLDAAKTDHYEEHREEYLALRSVRFLCVCMDYSVYVYVKLFAFELAGQTTNRSNLLVCYLFHFVLDFPQTRYFERGNRKAFFMLSHLKRNAI